MCVRLTLCYVNKAMTILPMSLVEAETDSRDVHIFSYMLQTWNVESNDEESKFKCQAI